MTTATRSQTSRSASGFRFRDISLLALFLVLTLGTGAIGSFATSDGMSWNDSLAKPSFNPPNSVFGPVWTTLYVMIAVAAWLVARKAHADRPLALTLWGVQLALNFAWSFIYFGAQEAGWAVLDIGALWVAILATTVMFARINRWAALLMVPYIGWVSFAAVLNFRIWQLN